MTREFRYLRGDGRTIWVAGTASSACDPVVGGVRILGAVVDITRLKLTETLRSEQAVVLGMIAAGAPLEATLGRLLQAVESQDPSMLASVLLVTEDGRHLESAAHSRLPAAFGDRIGRLPIEHGLGSCGHAAATGTPVYIEDAQAHPQFAGAPSAICREFGIRASWSHPIFDAQRRILGTLAVYGRQPGLPDPEQVQLIEAATDTAAICIERHRSGIETRRTLARLDLALSATGLGVWERDMRTDQLWWSPECLRILECEQAPDLAGWRAMVHPEDLSYVVETAQSAVTGDGDFHAEFRVVLADGRIKWLENRGRTELDAHGRPMRMHGTMRDVTDRRAAAEALRASEERFQLAMQGAADGLWDWDLRTGALYLSPRWKSMLGYDDAELVNEYATWERLTHADDVQPTLDRVRDVVEGRLDKYEVEFRMRHRDGRWVHVLSRGFLVSDDAGAAVRMVGTHVDLTARKRVEQALRDSEERSRLLVEAAIDAVITIEADGRIVEWNREAEHIFGHRRADVLGRSLADVVAPATERDALRLALRTFDADCRSSVLDQRTERIALRADGTTFPVELAVVALRHEGRLLFHAFVRDITERRRAEQVQAALESRLRQAQKMQAIGTLAGGIAHDFNNLLAVILGNVEALTRSEYGAAAAELDAIRQAASRGAMLVRQILTFSSSQAPDFEPLRLGDVVREVCELLRPTLPAGIELRLAVAPGCCPVFRGDATQLHQVLTNLCANAGHAYPKGRGRIDVRVADAELDGSTAVGSTSLPAGRYVTLAVADRGVGMESPIVERMFEPFFSTRPPDQGTGLGLAVVHGIVTAHAGAIAVQSAPGQGTTVTVWLPAAQDEPQVLLPRSEPAPRGAGQLALYVDDEPSLVDLAERSMQRLGYRVRAFTEPRAALAEFEREPGRFDLLVTDQSMPGLSGLELAAAVRTVRADLPIVLISGFLPPGLQEVADALGIDAHLGKPCTSRDLAVALQRAIDAARVRVRRSSIDAQPS